MTLYRVESPSGELVMIAPLKTIGEFLRLHKEAEHRVVVECGNGRVCKLHRGFSTTWREEFYNVTLSGV